MRVAQYVPFVEGMSPAGLIIAGVVLGVVAGPLLKRGLRGLAVGLAGGTAVAGRRLKDGINGRAGWWGSVWEEARARHESKMAAKRTVEAGAPAGAAVGDSNAAAEPGWTFETNGIH